MRTWNRTWQALWQFIGRSSALVNQNRNADIRAGERSEPRYDGHVESEYFDGRWLAALCEPIIEQVQVAQRNGELARQEALRRDRRAKRRSLTLLLKLLDQTQRQEFRESRHFHVIGARSGNCYRIHVGSISNIDVLHRNGKVRHRLCVQPTGDVPIYDVMAAQLLHLQDPDTEPKFLRKANVHPARIENTTF